LRWAEREVVEVYRREHRGVMAALRLEGEVLRATGGHPFWVVRGVELALRPAPGRIKAHEVGSLLEGRWVLARDLRPGDVVLFRQGQLVPLQSVRLDEVVEEVYNFQVAELQNYAVGACGVLVHNTNTEGTTGSGEQTPPSGPEGTPGNAGRPEPTPEELWEQATQAREAMNKALAADDLTEAINQESEAIRLEERAAQAEQARARAQADAARNQEASERAQQAAERRAAAQEAQQAARDEILDGRTPAEHAQRRGGQLLQEQRESNVGQQAGRSGGHGTPAKRAGAALRREANQLQGEHLRDIRDAMRAEADRLEAQGNADNHPGTP
jgi:hypothetical protein